MKSCQVVRQLLASLNSIYAELIRDCELLQKSAAGKNKRLFTIYFLLMSPLIYPSINPFIKPFIHCCPCIYLLNFVPFRLTCQSTNTTPLNDRGSPMLGLPKHLTESLSPSTLMPASPSLSSRVPFKRERNFSFANPSPLMKLILDGVNAKVSKMAAVLIQEYTV